MINFNELPDNNPNSFTTVAKGRYKATIEKAEMKLSQSGNSYLSIQYGLVNPKTNKSCGKLFDIITEPNHPLTKYKLKRFIEAIKAPITGEFELKDLTKIAPKKEILVDVTIDDKGDTPKNVVDVFAGEIYYPLAETIPTITEEIPKADASDLAALKELCGTGESTDPTNDEEDVF